MLNSIKRFIKSVSGSSAVEFALYLPILLLLVIGTTEVGYAISQSVMLEKSIRSGALYAARSDLPLSAASITAVTNVIQKGNSNGTGNFLIDGWSDTAATLTITVSNYTLTTSSSVLGSDQLPVITITARVPYQPILGNLMTDLGLGNITLSLSHEQAHIGV
ncbi:MAG: pilus assembly protein [Sneathiella sp.]|nr:pilus assembly protein [Sneathiella sp.]